jgi:hypothetical protein
MRHSIVAIPIVALSLSLTVFWGCGGNSASTPTASHDGKDHHEGDGHAHGKEEHAEEGPHHGHLIELGKEEYHLELTHDEATKTVSVYVLDGGAKNAIPIAEPEIILNLVVNGKPAQAKLTAAPQQGDPVGQSSRFSATDEKLLDALEAPKTTGRINVTIAGKPYAGQIVHHEHGEHGHK